MSMPGSVVVAAAATGASTGLRSLKRKDKEGFIKHTKKTIFFLIEPLRRPLSKYGLICNFQK